MSAMELDNDVSTVLASLRAETESPELISAIYELEDFYERKLWHQLTLSLDDFYRLEQLKESKVKIFNLFISKILPKLNPIKIIDFLLESFKDKPQDTLDNLLKLKEFLTKELKASNFSRNDNIEELIESDESLIYINLQISRYFLLLNDVKKAEEILEKLDSKFNNSDFENQFSSKINAAYYLTNCQLHKINENYNLFYSNGLLYLSTLDSDLSDEDKIKLCYDLCISALLGDKIYNFGELILHDILNIIKEGQYSWLYSMIVSLNAGNLKEFKESLGEGLIRSPFLKKFENFLSQKIIIMSLLELISLKSTTSKLLTFSEISLFTGAPTEEVELLIIKCFSLKLIKGYINQIEQTLVVTWLQPRILNLNQVKTLYNHLISWNNQVDQLSKEVYKSGGSIWAGL